MPEGRGRGPGDASWRGGAPGAPRKPQPAGYRWNREPDAAEVVRPRSRRGRSLRAGSALLACLAALVALILLFRPAPPPLLALVGAGYAENLDVPHNAWGLNALDRLAGLGKATNGIRALFGGGAYAPLIGPKSSPYLLDDPEGDAPRAWAEHAAGLKKRARTHKGPIILVLALHGSADAEGPFLLAERARPGSKPLRVQAVVDTLAALPTARPKLLVLDAAAMGEAPEFAGPGDDFARGLARVKIPMGKNVWILCSADVHQRSWVDEAAGMTAFGRALAEGLGGKAGANITLGALGEYLGRRTSAFAATTRGAIQSPTLACDLGIARLPAWAGAKGKAIRDAAHAQELVRSIVPSPVAGAKAEPPAATKTRLDAAWAAAARLEARDGARVLRTPASYAPAAWRRLRESLVRREQLLMHGYDNLIARGALGLTAATTKALDADLAALPGEIEAAAVVPLRQSAMLSVGPAAADPRAASLADKLRDADDAGLDKAVAEATPRAAAVAAATLARLVEEPDLDALARAADRLGRLFADVPAPAEVRLLSTLRDGLAPPAGRPSAELVTRAIRARRRAERLASGAVDPPAFDHAEAVWPWVRGELAEGDRARRSAEDLLLSTRPADHAEAGSLLAAAEVALDRATARAEVVRAALNRRDAALADLPFHARWVAGRPNNAGLVADVVGHWDATRALGEVLGRGPTGDLGPVEAASAAVERGYGRVLSAFEAVVRGPAGRNVLGPHELAEARGVPRTDRSAFVADTATPRPLSAPAEADMKALDLEWRRGRARLAMAELGDDLFRRANRLDTSAALREGLAAGSAALPSTLDALGPLLRRALGWLPKHIDTLSTAVPPLAATMTPASAPGLTVAEGLAPLLGPNRARSLARDPVGLARRRRLFDLLADRAERAWTDHEWAAGAAVYPEVARRYLADAATLGEGLLGPSWAKEGAPIVASRLAALTLVEPLGLSTIPAAPAWTSEREFPLGYRLDRGPTPEAPAVEGRPVAWVEGSADGLAVPVDATAGRVALRLEGPEADRTLAALYRSDPHDAAEHAPPPGPDRRRAEVASTVLFRGRRERAASPIDLHMRAERTQRAGPAPADAGLLVRADEEFGGADAALAIVFDNSTSMNYVASGEKATKYQVAVESLEEVLQGVPLKAGTWVGLWTYGVERPSGGPVGNTDDARLALGEPAWNPAESPTRLLSMLRYDATLRRPPVGLWDATPLVTSMRAALRGLRESRRARKQMVVLTDGADSFLKDPEKVRRAILDEFGGQGVVVHVLFFATDIEFNIAQIDTLIRDDADPAQRRKLREQYLTILKNLAESDKDVPKSLGAVAEIAPRGTFATATQRRQLVDGLAESLASRPRYALFDRAGAGVAEGPRDRLVRPREAGPDDAERLKAGDYRVVVGEATAWVRLPAGPTLILDLSRPDSGKPSLRRGLLSDGPAAIDRAEAGGWRLATAPGGPRPGSGFEVILEDTARREARPAGGVPVVEQFTPRASWLEVLAAEPPARALELRSLPGRAAPSWGLVLSGPPPAGARLKLWWSETAPMPGVEVPASRLSPGATLDGSGTILESIGIEPHEVADTPGGPRSMTDCLAIRLRHAPGRPVLVDRVELSGLPAAHTEQRIYAAADRVTALYWPASSELKSLRLADVGAFRDDPRTRSIEVKIDPRLVR